MRPFFMTTLFLLMEALAFSPGKEAIYCSTRGLRLSRLTLPTKVKVKGAALAKRAL